MKEKELNTSTQHKRYHATVNYICMRRTKQRQKYLYRMEIKERTRERDEENVEECV